MGEVAAADGCCVWELLHMDTRSGSMRLSCAYVAKTPQTTSGLRLCLYRIVQAWNAQRGIAELFR